jgi:hypothetical protein
MRPSLTGFVSAALLAVASALAQPGCVTGQCDAMPTCGSGVEVKECPPGADCYEVEACGSTILCTDDIAPCDAYPGCQQGYREVTSCPPGVMCVEESMCGSTILCAPNGPCTSSADCGPDDFCNFRDGLCGGGEVGECAPRPPGCSDGIPTCFCDGTVSDLGCEGLGGDDFDATGGSCVAPADAIPCAHLFCIYGPDDFCRITPDDTGGAPSAGCDFAPEGCDPATCACLADETAACGGSCEDGPNGPTITCPGG